MSLLSRRSGIPGFCEGGGEGKERRESKGKKERTGKERKAYFLALKKGNKICGLVSLFITLYAVTIFDVPVLLMLGAMKNA